MNQENEKQVERWKEEAVEQAEISFGETGFCPTEWAVINFTNGYLAGRKKSSEEIDKLKETIESMVNANKDEVHLFAVPMKEYIPRVKEFESTIQKLKEENCKYSDMIHHQAQREANLSLQLQKRDKLLEQAKSKLMLLHGRYSGGVTEEIDQWLKDFNGLEKEGELR